MNIGLVGCGGVAQSHMRIYQNIKDAKVVAVSDIDLKKAKTTASIFRVNKFFSEYVDLLEIKDLDLVDICTPTSTHASIVVDAAKYGHDILVEKPMAKSVEECDRMIRETKREGVKLCVCHNQLFHPSVRQAKSFVDSEGRHVVYCRTSVKENPTLLGAPKWQYTPEEKGILWEAGAHTAYLQLHFLKDISEVYACGSKVSSQVYDNFTVLLRSSNESYGWIEVSWIVRVYSELNYEIVTSDGKRYLVDPERDSIKEMVENSLYSDVRRVLNHLPPPIGLGTKSRYYVGHYHLIMEYLRDIKKDLPPPVRPEDGRKVIGLLESIEKSLDTHQVVKSYSSPN